MGSDLRKLRQCPVRRPCFRHVFGTIKAQVCSKEVTIACQALHLIVRQTALRGCLRGSEEEAGCDHCYAETSALRSLQG